MLVALLIAAFAEDTNTEPPVATEPSEGESTHVPVTGGDSTDDPDDKETTPPKDMEDNSGKVINRDLGLLQQHVNGWDVELK